MKKTNRKGRQAVKRLMVALACLPFTAGMVCSAQTMLNDYHPGKNADGVVYFLPKTAMRLTLLLEKTTYTPGDFCRYAQHYLRLNDVAQQPSTSYRIISIALQPFGVADSTKGYQVKFNAKSVATNMSLTADGRLLAINAKPTAEAEPKAFVPAPKPAHVNPRQFMSEEILAAGSTSKMAELTAREIYDLRENRNLLIKGQADFMPNDGNQMRLMLNQLEAQEQALSELFKGTTVRDTVEEVLTICPDGPVDRQMGFRLSQLLGMVDADDLSGEPYYITVENISSLPPAATEATGKSKKKQPESGIYVNVPGKMRVTVLRGDDAIATTECAAAQFGYTELLSGELFNKHYTTHLWLNPTTGAVERLEAEQPR